MKKISLILIMATFIFVACKQKNRMPDVNAIETGAKEIVVSKVLQASNYTYLFGKSDGEDLWVAVNKFEAEQGKSYFFSHGAVMVDFYSKELDTTFPEIYFLDEIWSEKTQNEKNQVLEAHSNAKEKAEVEKKDVKVEPLADGYTVEKIFEKKAFLEGEIVKIKGEVVKVNENIMNYNWVHIQDGTSFEGSNDFVLTTNEVVQVGDQIIFEGIIILNKDFGAGYKYDVIMMDAVVVK